MRCKFFDGLRVSLQRIEYSCLRYVFSLAFRNVIELFIFCFEFVAHSHTRTHLYFLRLFAFFDHLIFVCFFFLCKRKKTTTVWNKVGKNRSNNKTKFDDDENSRVQRQTKQTVSRKIVVWFFTFPDIGSEISAFSPHLLRSSAQLIELRFSHSFSFARFDFLSNAPKIHSFARKLVNKIFSAFVSLKEAILKKQVRCGDVFDETKSHNFILYMRNMADCVSVITQIHISICWFSFIRELFTFHRHLLRTMDEGEWKRERERKKMLYFFWHLHNLHSECFLFWYSIGAVNLLRTLFSINLNTQNELKKTKRVIMPVEIRVYIFRYADSWRGEERDAHEKNIYGKKQIQLHDFQIIWNVNK